ncbi:MAG: BlaI/MecI/CopY family transcriptional regulator [Acidobacteria bacterium]|nr:BlaI/MecI/CopY family transcriptional regulator [Acidobacteriota bacterium]
MNTKSSTHPELTETELEVMKTLWSQGESSAREAHERLAHRLGWAYTTSRTTLDRMVDKGLVERRSSHGLYLYDAAVSRPVGLAGLVQRLAGRVLEVEASRVVSLFTEGLELSAEEVAELEALIEESEP